MVIKLTIILTLLLYGECLNVYSSFWAPLYDPRILNYKVEAKFDPNGGRAARENYNRNYGYRGERLIADLGRGQAPRDVTADDKIYGDVIFYQTYGQGAHNNQVK